MLQNEETFSNQYYQLNTEPLKLLSDNIIFPFLNWFSTIKLISHLSQDCYHDAKYGKASNMQKNGINYCLAVEIN